MSASVRASPQSPRNSNGERKTVEYQGLTVFFFFADKDLFLSLLSISGPLFLGPLLHLAHNLSLRLLSSAYTDGHSRESEKSFLDHFRFLREWKIMK